MQRIQTLLQKLTELSAKKGELGLIDVDLMMDYTRVIYADLAEMHNRLAFNNTLPDIPKEVNQPTPVKQEQLEPQNIAIPTSKAAKASIQNSIGINDTYLFTSELFDNDRETYEMAINTLDSFDDYELAEQWLHANYTWDMDDETVQSFMSMLDAHYKLP